ncbi:MAG: toll/interleukin-1 receptor domain-containing protein [bacterium]|nr:toll/interleukin-1 receptor domain-containing protein [bacterium]
MAHKKLFISYKHLDDEWRDEIKKWLAPLEKKGLIDVWDDTEIPPGSDWREEIKKHLAEAKLAVLLVTQDFLNSDFIAQNELPVLVKASKKQKDPLKIFWIAVSPSTYEDSKEIEPLQAANDPSRPLSSLPPAELDVEMLAIYKKIKEVLEE